MATVVWVLEDSNPATPAVSGTVRVEISTPPTLSVALSDGAKNGAYSFVNLMGVLSTVELSGVGGIPPYTFTLLANDNFGIDEDGKNFRITAAFASAAVATVVWVLEDSNPETPAVSGTVQVEIFEAPKAQYTVPSGVQVSVSEGTVTPVSGEAGTFQFDPKTNDGVVLKVTGGDLAVTFMDWKLVIGEGNVMEFINAYAIRPSNLPEFTAGFDNLGDLVSQIQYWPIDSGSEQLKWGSSGLNLIGATIGDTNEEREAGLVGKQAFIGQLPSSFSPTETGLVVVMCGYRSHSGIEDYVCDAYQNGITSVPAFKPPSAENELRYAVVNDPYSETINIPVVGGVPGATGYTFALSPASGYSIGSTSGNTIVLNVTDVAYIDAGVYYVTVSIHDSQTPPQSGTFVLEVRVVPKLTFSDTTLTISQTESASLLSLVNGGNTMYAEDNERTFVVISDNNAHFMAGNDGVLTVGGAAELVGINTVTVQVMDTVPSQAATATLVIDVMERGVKFDRESSNLPASIDPGIDVPLSITLQATGGSQSPSYTFSITEGDETWLSIVSPNVLVVGAGAPASGDHTFKIKVVDGNSTKTDGRQEDEAEITFALKPQAQATANGDVVVSGSESADGSYTSGQTFTFDPKTEQGVTLVLGGASDTAVVTAENGQIKVTLKYFTQTNVFLAAFTPSSGTFVMLDGKKLAQAVKDAYDAGEVAISFGGGTDSLSFYVEEEIDEALAIDGGLLAIIAPSGLVNGDGVDIVSGVTYLLCNIDGFGSILCELRSPSTIVPSTENALRYAVAGQAYNAIINIPVVGGVPGATGYTFALSPASGYSIGSATGNTIVLNANATYTDAGVNYVTVSIYDSQNPPQSGTFVLEVRVVSVLTFAPDSATSAIEGIEEVIDLTPYAKGGNIGNAAAGSELSFMVAPATDGFKVGNDNMLTVAAAVGAGNYTIAIVVKETNPAHQGQGEITIGVAGALSASGLDTAIVQVELSTEVGVITPSGGIGAYTFALVSGNGSGYFTINSSLGLISVNNASESEDGNSYILVWTLNDGDDRSPEVTGTVSVQFTKSPIAKNALRYAVENILYSETISIPVVGGVPDSNGYTFALSPASGYSIGSTSGNTIVLSAAATYTDAGVNYVTVSIHDSQTPPQSGTFVLEVRVVPTLAFADLVLTITQTRSESVAEHVTGGNTMYAEDNQRTFILGGAPDGLTIDDGVIMVGGNVPYGGYAFTISVTDTQPSQTAESNVSLSVVFKPLPVQVDTSGFPSSLDPNAQLPYSVTLSGIGGSLNPTFIFSLADAPSYVSIVDGNVVITVGPSAGDTVSFKIIVDDTAASYDGGPMTAGINISFEAAKAQYKVPSGVQVEVSEGTVTPVSGEANTFQFDPKTADGVVLKVTGGDLTVTFIDWNLVIGEGNIMEFINAYAIRPSNLPEFDAGFDNFAGIFAQSQSWSIDSGSETLKWGVVGLNLIGAAKTGSEDGLVGKQGLIGQLPSGFSPTETGLVVVMCGYANVPWGEEYNCGAYQDGITRTPAFSSSFAKATRSTQSVKPAVRTPSAVASGSLVTVSESGNYNRYRVTDLSDLSNIINIEYFVVNNGFIFSAPKVYYENPFFTSLYGLVPYGGRPNNPLFEADGTTPASGFFEGGFWVFFAEGEENLYVTAGPYLADDEREKTVVNSCTFTFPDSLECSDDSYISIP